MPQVEKSRNDKVKVTRRDQVKVTHPITTAVYTQLLMTLCITPCWAQQLYAEAVRGLPPLEIEDVRVIATSPTPSRSWIFVKVITSEPGLYGIGSAHNAFLSWSVKAAIEKHLAPFWIGKDADRIEDLWQSTHTRSYWRNGNVTNVAQAALDMALWDIKGKRANMPVYQLLGGKVRDAVPLYARVHDKKVIWELWGIHLTGLDVG